MGSSSFLSARLRSSVRVISVIIAVSVVLIGAVLLLHYGRGVQIGTLTRDPTVLVGAPFYTGFLSQVGIFFWAGSAAVCVFSASVLSKHIDNLDNRRFLIVSGALTLVLGIDDVFLLHEEVFPLFGVPAEAVVVSYAVFVLFYLVKFYSVIMKTEYILLVMALSFFGMSVIVDVIQPRGLYLLEDGAKLVGIVSWLAYFFRAGASAIYHDAGLSNQEVERESPRIVAADSSRVTR